MPLSPFAPLASPPAQVLQQAREPPADQQAAEPEVAKAKATPQQEEPKVKSMARNVTFADQPKAKATIPDQPKQQPLDPPAAPQRAPPPPIAQLQQLPIERYRSTIMEAMKDGTDDSVPSQMPHMELEEIFSYMSEIELDTMKRVMDNLNLERPCNNYPVEGQPRRQFVKDKLLPPEQVHGLLNRPQYVWREDRNNALCLACILIENGGQCSWHKCCKAFPDEAMKPELKFFVSKFCLHFEWVDDKNIKLKTGLGKLARMFEKANITKQDQWINSNNKSVKIVDMGYEEYLQLPNIQAGANSKNQKKSWKTEYCLHWQSAKGCGNADIFAYYHQGYDSAGHDGTVYASQEAMRYNLENKPVDQETWSRVTTSLPKPISYAEVRKPEHDWKPMQIRDLSARLTDAQALARTEADFCTTAMLRQEYSHDQHRSSPYKQGWQSYDSSSTKDEQWKNDDRHVAKGQKIEHSSGDWSHFKPTKWDSTSKSDEETDRSYREKWSTWKEDQPKEWWKGAQGWHPKVEPSGKGDHWTKPKDDPWPEYPKYGGRYSEPSSASSGPAKKESKQDLLDRLSWMMDNMKVRDEYEEIVNQLRQMG